MDHAGLGYDQIFSGCMIMTPAFFTFWQMSIPRFTFCSGKHVLVALYRYLVWRAGSKARLVLLRLDLCQKQPRWRCRGLPAAHGTPAVSCQLPLGLPQRLTPSKPPGGTASKVISRSRNACMRCCRPKRNGIRNSLNMLCFLLACQDPSQQVRHLFIFIIRGCVVQLWLMQKHSSTVLLSSCQHAISLTQKANLSFTLHVGNAERPNDAADEEAQAEDTEMSEVEDDDEEPEHGQGSSTSGCLGLSCGQQPDSNCLL